MKSTISKFRVQTALYSSALWAMAACIAALVYLGGCRNSPVDASKPNQPPKTYMWLRPDSTLRLGNSSQHLHWWADDPDGLVQGYILAIDSLFDTTGAPLIDAGHPNYADARLSSIAWQWTSLQDSILTFPLLSKLGRFQVLIRAVDNTYRYNLDQGAVLRSAGNGNLYWDKNDDGLFDSTDVVIPGFGGSIDPKGAVLTFPIKNQPPSIYWASNPYNPSIAIVQPETTFTAASFAWTSTDPDGNRTVVGYELALNDTNDATRLLTMTARESVATASIYVPRERSEGMASGEVTADVYSGTFAKPGRLLGQLGHLKLNDRNVFYVRARDIAGDVSGFIRLPGDATRPWYVKNPTGKVLIVDDYANSADTTAVLRFYMKAIDSVANMKYDVLNIGRGLGSTGTAQDKRDGKPGRLVPNLTDPALVYTFQLFDAVLWYSDVSPSLGIAQASLFYYLNHPAPGHHAKVLFTTKFSETSDPRGGAITDFAPLDSVSSVNLSLQNLPRLGESSLPPGIRLYPTAAGTTAGYDTLSVLNLDPSQRLNYVSVFLRAVYKRADADYIYSIQPDSRNPVSYGSLAGINDLRGSAVVPAGSGTRAWVCGDNGSILRSTDGGVSWVPQASGVLKNLFAIQFIDQSNGWAVGSEGAMVRTTDGGANWNPQPVVTFEELHDVQFRDASNGFVCGSTGQILRTTNAGANWVSVDTAKAANVFATLRSIRFADANTGIAVGDSTVILKTTNGGLLWRRIDRSTAFRQLNGCATLPGGHFLAAGLFGTILQSTDAGETWNVKGQFTTPTGTPVVRRDSLFAMTFSSPSTGYITSMNGQVFRTTNAGDTWQPDSTRIEQNSGKGQSMYGIQFADALHGIATGGGGVILQTTDGGATWNLQPKYSINVAVADGRGGDNTRSFVLFGLPLHLLNGPVTGAPAPAWKLINHVLHDEFGL